MTPERWQQINQLLDVVSKLEPSQRRAYLDRVCAGDVALRREVESLLASEEQGAAGGFLKTPAPMKFAEVLAQERGNKMSGTVTLRAIVGPMQGQDFIFNEHDVFIFGRAEDCDARLTEKDQTVVLYRVLF